MTLVRRVGASDVARLRDVRLRALQTDPLAFGSTYEHEAAFESSAWEKWAREHGNGPDRATFLAQRNDVTVGIAGGFRFEAEATSFGLFSMWVAPDARRVGIGRQLVHAVTSWAEASGAHDIKLWVTQASARTFYEQCGFVDDGRRQPLPHAPHVIEIGMTRRVLPRASPPAPRS